MSFKYSVIIPHYNCEDGLERLLKSIPNKDTIEVIVVDDRSSTELFKDVINKSHLVNISGYINEGVKGAGAARNIGLEKAKGEFLVFADSDDFFTENAFNVIDNVINSSKEVHDVYFFNVTSQSSSGDVGYRHVKNSNLVLDYINKKGSFHNERLRFTHNVPWGKVFRHSLIKENIILFDETIIANDGMFSLKAGKAAISIEASDDVIYCVTQTNESLTAKKNVSNYRVRLEVFVRYYSYLTHVERRQARVSPLPLLYIGKDYGIKEVVRSVIYLKKNKISLLKNLPLSSTKFKTFYTRISKQR